MATPTALTLATAIKEALLEETFALAVSPVVQMRPRLEVATTHATKLLVIPSEQTFEGLSRGSLVWRPTIDLGLVAKCDPEDLVLGGKLLAVVIELGRFTSNLSLAGYQVGRAAAPPEHDPLWSPERLDKGVFLSVLRVPFAASIARGAAS